MCTADTEGEEGQLQPDVTLIISILYHTHWFYWTAPLTQTVISAQSGFNRSLNTIDSAARDSSVSKEVEMHRPSLLLSLSITNYSPILNIRS